MPKVYMYVVARDFGFAPNPFNGICTLATCKPKIRRVAKAGDWVVGMGGSKIKATGRCIYLMQVTGAMSFNEYWDAPMFKCKRPVRNGSRKLMVGDNIYSRGDGMELWTQADSHHSNPDGSPELWNIATDTSVDRVLYSTKFVYYGSAAPIVPKILIDEIGYTNRIDHRTFESWQCEPLIAWLEGRPADQWNRVLADPFQFNASGARYSKKEDRVIAV
jgi:hypothetical protein